MAVLTTAKRKSLPGKSFVFPEKRAYPIHDEAHARNALARVSQFGSPAEKAAVRAAVHKKYPGIGKASTTDNGGESTPTETRITRWRKARRQRMGD